MQGQTKTILHHPVVCPHVDEAMHNRAREENISRNLTKSPSKPTPSRLFIPLTAPTTFQQPAMQYYLQLANAATAGPSSSPAGFIPMSGLAYTMQPGALFGGLMPSPGPTAPLSSTVPSPIPSLLELHLNQLAFTPLQPSLLQSPLVGPIGTGAIQSGTKRMRTQNMTMVKWLFCLLNGLLHIRLVSKSILLASQHHVAFHLCGSRISSGLTFLIASFLLPL